MCSGKTTLGRAVCERTGMRFVDLDCYIEERTGMTVKEIFASLGEEAFRTLEGDALQQVAAMQDVIVACGGGTPCQPGAMELMNRCGLTVRLVPARRRLVKRLMAGRRKRPLLAEISTTAEMADFYDFASAKREAHYCKAAVKFDSTRLDSVEEVEATVDRFIDEIIESTIYKTQVAK